MKKKIRRKLMQTLLFFIKLNLLVIPLYLLIYLDFSYQPLQNLVAFLSYKFLSYFGIKVSLNQSSLVVLKEFNIFYIDINMDCTGWKSMYALLALTIATPGIKFKKKGVFLLISLPLLFLINIGRIVVTIYLSLINPTIFAFLHDILWSWGLVVAVLGIWILWVKHEKRI